MKLFEQVVVIFIPWNFSNNFFELSSTPYKHQKNWNRSSKSNFRDMVSRKLECC